MATIEDIQRKHKQFISSQDSIVDKITSYGVNITKETPFQRYAAMVEEAVAAKLAGILDGATPFELNERDFKKATVIRRYAFYQNAALANLVIPEWITSIDPNAFYGCTGLVTVRIPKKIRLQAACFNGCSALTKVYLPDVTSVDEIPVLVNVNVFNGTTCEFEVTNEDVKAIYISDSNWNTYTDRFVIKEATV